METIIKILPSGNLEALFDNLSAGDSQLLAPVKKGNILELELVKSYSDINLDALLTTQSVKKVAFPKVEKILEYALQKTDVTVSDPYPDEYPEIILFGVRPCDASGFRSLTSIFNWDSADSHYLKKMEKITVISFACTNADEYCFCTSVGGNPGNTANSDIQFTKINDQEFLVEILTEKGRSAATRFMDLMKDPVVVPDKKQFLADVPVVFDLNTVVSKTTARFDSPIWLQQSLRCIGCGACAFVCPTCACFDVQDERTLRKGVRFRTWDSCGFSLFTLHSSGHNPRDVQSQRWRQRIMHKFSYMPQRLNVVGCEGCGRCSRACPADMNIKEHLINIAES